METPPIYDFQKLKPITMTVTSALKVQELDLPAIFCFLPVTDQVLPPNNFRRKQGKIQLPPELNRPGEIISMRWEKSTRGIVRSATTKSFPNAIIMDIGTMSKIVSYKLGKTIEVTGATSTNLVKEASDLIFRLVRNCQSQIQYIRTCPQLDLQIKNLFVQYLNKAVSPIPDILADGTLFNHVKDWETRGLLDENLFPNNSGVNHIEIHNLMASAYAVDNGLGQGQSLIGQNSANFIAAAIWRFYYPHFRLSDEKCMNNIFSGMERYRGNLYVGELALSKLDSHMVNVASNLGYSINQSRLKDVMDQPPFKAIFTNVKKSSPVKILYFYQKQDRTTGKIVSAKHTITVNKGGYVKISGPTLKAMEPVYYTFLKIVLENYDTIRSVEDTKSVRVKIGGTGSSVDTSEIRALFDSRRELYHRIMNNQVPMIRSEDAYAITGSTVDDEDDHSDEIMEADGVLIAGDEDLCDPSFGSESTGYSNNPGVGFQGIPSDSRGLSQGGIHGSRPLESGGLTERGMDLLRVSQNRSESSTVPPLGSSENGTLQQNTYSANQPISITNIPLKSTSDFNGGIPTLTFNYQPLVSTI